MGSCIHLAQTRGGFYKQWFNRSRLKKIKHPTTNPRLFLGETWSAFKREQVSASVLVFVTSHMINCNLNHELFQSCQSRTPHHCQYSFIPPPVKISTISQHHLLGDEWHFSNGKQAPFSCSFIWLEMNFLVAVSHTLLSVNTLWLQLSQTVCVCWQQQIPKKSFSWCILA